MPERKRMQKKIITVDDSVSICQMVSFILTRAGYCVIEAVDGKDALAKLHDVKVDMMITDLNMPIMDGVQLIRRVRTFDAYKSIPILMLTTESQEAKKMEGKAAGATGWIVKPFHADQLIAIIQKLLK
jgi:two-component system chemotaxis response regulator CheY